MTVTIYHNPRCSKSRQTLELLREKGLDPQIVEYLETPPDATTLKTLLGKLGVKPRAFMRTKEAIFAQLALDEPNLTDDELISSMVAHPILIERPIVVANDRVALGRPPENVLDIL